MRQITHKLMVQIARRLAYAGVSYPFVLLLMRQLRAEGNLSRGQPSTEKQNPRFTLLALTPNRFIRDLELLEETGKFRVIKLPPRWQAGVLGLFWEGRVEKAITLKWDYLKDDLPHWIEQRRTASRRFIQKLLAKLQAELKIDAVITTAIWYPQDFDWGYAAEQNGTPLIAMHKENLAATLGHRNFWRFAAGELGGFYGSSLIVHNNIMKDLFIEAGYIEPEKIRALGAMRMDEYVAQVAAQPHSAREAKRPLVVFFSFEWAPQLIGLVDLFPSDRTTGMPQFFCQTHASFGRLAVRRPDVDFVIKPKFGGIWEEEIVKALRDDGTNIDELPNLDVVLDADAHQLIFDADIVCSYGSTTLLEAGIAGKVVIMPCFAEAAYEKFRDFVQFYGRDDLFEMANSGEDLMEKIDHYLAYPNAAAARLNACRAEFEKYVSPLSGGARENYVNAIIDTIKTRASLKMRPPN